MTHHHSHRMFSLGRSGLGGSEYLFRARRMLTPAAHRRMVAMFRRHGLVAERTPNGGVNYTDPRTGLIRFVITSRTAWLRRPHYFGPCSFDHVRGA